MFVPEAEHEMLSGLFRSLEEEGRARIENHVLTKGGQSLLVDWSGATVPGDAGQMEYFFGVGVDITERKRLEQAKINFPEI